MPAIDPSLLAGGAGPEWTIAPIDDSLGAVGDAAVDAAPAGDGFSTVLGRQISALSELQSEAATASQSLAAGTATDPASVVMAVERARLSMQLASQLRTKGVEAINEIFRTQV